MLEIKEILLNLDKILLKEEVKKSIICDTLNKIISLDLKPKNIKVKNNTLFLDIKPIFKNEILFKKDIINKELRKSLKEKTPENII